MTHNKHDVPRNVTAQERSSVSPFVVHEQSIGYGRTVLSAHAGKFANFLIEVDSIDYKAHTEALKACTESETAVHPGDWKPCEEPKEEF